MTSTGSTRDASWRRLSARMLLVHPVREAGGYLPFLLVLVFAGHARGDQQWRWGLLAAVVIIALSVLRWATTTFRITSEQVQLRTGLLHRKTIAAPADRIRSVDVTASALHRLLGLAKVDIGTGSHEMWGKLTLDALPAAEAAALRAELLHRSATTAPVAPSSSPDVASSAAERDTVTLADPPAAVGLPPEPGDTELARLDLGWVRFAPFTLSGVLGAAFVLGLASRVLDQLGTPVGEVGAVKGAVGYLQRTPIWLDVVEVLAAFVGFAAILSVGGYLMSYWGFRLSRHAQGSLQVTRGLLTTRTTSIEERRLRGVELSEPLLLRLVHAARVSGITTGLRSKGVVGSSLLLPPAPREVARDVAIQILGDPAALEVRIVSHGPAARRRRLIRALLPALLLVALCALAIWTGAPQWLALPGVVAVPVAALLATDRYRSLGHALAGDALVTRAGSLERRLGVLRREGIIGWNLRQTYFQRRAGLATLIATTAAGRHRYAVTDVPLAVALSLADRAVPGLIGEFLLVHDTDPGPDPGLGPGPRPSSAATSAAATGRTE
jgi:putative membrane protein